MKRIAAGVLAVAAGGSVLLTSGAAVAASPRFDLRVDIVNVLPDPVQLPTDGRFSKAVVTVISKNAARVEVTLKPIGFGSRGAESKETRGFHSDDRGSFTGFFNKNDKPGKWLATAVAIDKSGRKVVDTASFDVEGPRRGVDRPRRKIDTEISSWSVFPGVVRKGKSIFFKGRLTSEERRFKSLDGQEIGIYFRSHPRREWQLVTETETNRFGKFSAKGRASKSGEYRAVFEGNDAANGAESEAIRVRVKRGFGGGFGR